MRLQSYTYYKTDLDSKIIVRHIKWLEGLAETPENNAVLAASYDQLMVRTALLRARILGRAQ